MFDNGGGGWQTDTKTEAWTLQLTDLSRGRLSESHISILQPIPRVLERGRVNPKPDSESLWQGGITMIIRVWFEELCEIFKFFKRLQFYNYVKILIE